ncbi:bifunctional glycosyltransferase/CDP-glycerol:glycerophosphate glycerophosphotransferase [Actinocorallia longicatena]|uniref:Glycosyltransferase 2-like domain-containing protein n=1 Tax=Actinocorallia longicatena TaxID=111803 RepID=A0ABP6QGV5_9ACTN
MSPKLSVVVPVHDVEDYLAACLDSLAAQTLTDLEVVMVDDGSTDASSVIAKAMAGRDPRFRLVQQDPAGPGPARNAGVRLASGEYLAFADADDVVPPDAYRLMVASLDRTGSDFATGAVERLQDGRLVRSVLHQGLHAERLERTHVSRHEVLVRDRTPWNKVFRRSFWDAHLFVFPAGLYEDPPVNVRAHAVAKAVDVLPEVVYHWRKRDGSITEERYDSANLEQRLASARTVRDDLVVRAPKLVGAYDRHVLVDVELRVLFEGLERLDEAAGPLRIGAGLAAAMDPASVAGLPAIERLRLHLLATGAEDRLRELLRFERLGGTAATTVTRRGRRWYADLPFAGSEPDHLYDVTAELHPVARVDRCDWTDGVLRLEGHAYVRHLDAAGSSIRLWLVSARGLGLVRVPLTRVDRPDVTAGSGQSAVCYDASGFTAEIPATALRTLGRFRPADWRLYVEIVNQGVRRRRSLGNPGSAAQKWPAAVRLSGGLQAEAVAGPGQYLLRVRRIEAEITGHEVTGDGLVLSGRLAGRPGDRTMLVADSGSVKVRAVAATDGRDFRVVLPLADLAEPIGSGWTFKIGGRALRTELEDAVVPVPGGELAFTRTRFGTFRVVARTPVPTVTGVGWTSDGELRLTGVHSGRAEDPAVLRLRRRRSSEEYTVPLTWEDGGVFSASFRPAAMPGTWGEIPLGRGRWEVLGEDDTPVVVARSGFRSLPAPRVAGDHEVAVTLHKVDELGLKVEAALTPAERGKYAQARLSGTAYRAWRRRPVLDLAVFDAYKGRQYSCNPRGIFEEMRRRTGGEGGGIDCVWVTADGRFPVPDGARVVLAGSEAHYEALARARYVFGNFSQEPWYAKREGQTYVQCWHGTPLKRLGRDLREMSYKRTEGRDWTEHDVPQWDLLLAQNAFSVPLFRRAFGYDGEVLVSGYPRNDALHRPDAAARAAEVRRRLGVPEGKRVVMYAPTWRDDLHSAIGKRGFRLELDLNRLAGALGDDHVVLLRTHYLVTDRPAFRPGGGVIDVTTYPDIADLYLITDALMTDYSSAMFDFASTGRPMFFYTYDLERYRDHVRGFYFDFEAEAPGPLLRTPDEVFDALGELDAAHPGRERYADFAARYCPHEDGSAAGRVLDHLS